MTKDKLDQLSEYVGFLMRHMRLQHWTVKVESQHSDDGLGASIQCVYGRLMAYLRVADDFWECPIEEQRETLVHELIHLHFDAMDRVARNLEGVLSKEGFEIHSRVHMASMETGVDAMATVLAQHIPLPLWPANEVNDTKGVEVRMTG